MKQSWCISWLCIRYCFWNGQRGCWIIPELSLDYPSIIPRLSFNYPWIILGSSLDYFWIIPRVSLDYPLIILGLSWDCTWIITGVSLDFPQDFPHDYPWIIPKPSLDYCCIIPGFMGISHVISVKYYRRREQVKLFAYVWVLVSLCVFLVEVLILNHLVYSFKDFILFVWDSESGIDIYNGTLKTMLTLTIFFQIPNKH